MNHWEILIGVILGLAVNETCDLSPWIGKRLVRLSVRMKYNPGERRDVRAKELGALIDQRPGKLFKLITGLWFAAAALPGWVNRTWRLKRDLSVRKSNLRDLWTKDMIRLEDWGARIFVFKNTPNGVLFTVEDESTQNVTAVRFSHEDLKRMRFKYGVPVSQEDPYSDEGYLRHLLLEVEKVEPDFFSRN